MLEGSDTKSDTGWHRRMPYLMLLGGMHMALAPQLGRKPSCFQLQERSGPCVALLYKP